MMLYNRDHVRNEGYRRLRDITIGILGLGDIGRESKYSILIVIIMNVIVVARYCKFLGMTVWGMTRTPVPVENRLSCVDQYR